MKQFLSVIECHSKSFLRSQILAIHQLLFALYQNGTEQVYSKEWKEDYAKAIDKGE